MDLIQGNIGRVYLKYLAASMASALVMSIYSFVDTIAVGQAEGPTGAAAMAVINPLYGIIVFISVLCGVGGAVLYGNARGEGKLEKANALFSAACGLMVLIMLLLWGAFALFRYPILTFFGADETIMPTVIEYAELIIAFIPVFVASVFISSFIRNDGAPNLAMAAVIIGGCVNIFGDWFFVFPMGMGMRGAATATVLGTAVQVVILCIHFFTKKCTLRLVKPLHVCLAISQTISIGFGASVLDLGTVILSIIANNQIMRYGDTTALAVFGVVATIAALIQAMFCGVGQAIQPIVSVNCGAKQSDRIRKTWRMSLFTVIIMGILFTAVCELFPKSILRLFVDVTPELLAAAPAIVRPYSLLYLFLGITVLATYHLQSIMHGKMSLTIALLRSAIVSGLLLCILPLFLDLLGVWLAMPIAELIVAAIAITYIQKRTII